MSFVGVVVSSGRSFQETKLRDNRLAGWARRRTESPASGRRTRPRTSESGGGPVEGGGLDTACQAFCLTLVLWFAMPQGHPCWDCAFGVPFFSLQEQACQYSVGAFFGALGGGGWCSGLSCPLFFLRAVNFLRPTTAFAHDQQMLLPLPLLPLPLLLLPLLLRCWLLDRLSRFAAAAADAAAAAAAAVLPSLLPQIGGNAVRFFDCPGSKCVVVFDVFPIGFVPRNYPCTVLPFLPLFFVTLVCWSPFGEDFWGRTL